MISLEFQQPAADQVEVSLFGPGFGEAILVHLGSGEWMAVDSCVDGGRVAQLDYLDRIGVDLKSSIKLQVVSHWHDDHIAGLSRFFERAPEASLYFPAALTTKEFLTYAELLNADDPNPLARETKEFTRTFDRVISEKRRREPVTADRQIYRSEFAEIFALSPSSAAYDRFIANIGSLIPSAAQPQRRRRIGALKPNPAAVVLQITTPAGLILLGSDLEELHVRGWSTLVATSVALKKGNLILKVPHHGSANAHYDDLWSLYLDPACISVLTPFMHGGVALPTPADANRITALSAQSYITAKPQRPPAQSRSNEVERALRRDAVRLRKAMPRLGHIRLRSVPGQPGAWTVEQFGAALPLADIGA